jgi:hypothetical protein
MSGSARITVIGTGPVAAEVVRNLGLVGIPAAVHSPEDFWRTLRLAELQDCYCAVAADGSEAARRRLNLLSQVAGVDFVNVVLGADGITIDAFPFGGDPDCACLECSASLAAAEPAPTHDPIAASIAGALAAAAALHCSGQAARRLSIPELDGASTAIQLERSATCRVCTSLWRTPRIIRTRNRWSASDFLKPEATALAGQRVRLSDPVVTACRCADCGHVGALADFVNRPAAAVATAPPICPGCGAAAVQVEVRDEFSLGELMDRFGGNPVPAKFALAKIGGLAVCFDLEATAPDPGGGT